MDQCLILLAVLACISQAYGEYHIEFDLGTTTTQRKKKWFLKTGGGFMHTGFSFDSSLCSGIPHYIEQWAAGGDGGG